MGRLIDADSFKNFIESLPKNTNGTSRVYDEASILRFIDAQPTAYDVEKVEEQIEEMFGVDPMYYGTEARWAVDKAIDIVKRGGVE